MHEYFPNMKPDFKFYDPDRKVLGKTMREHLRFAVCYWHTFCYMGGDPFGSATYHRPWHQSGDMEDAKKKADAAFEFFEKLGAPYFCFHDRDIAPEGKTLEESNKNVRTIAEIFQKKMEKSKIKLLWGTANLFTNPRFMSGASTNPNMEVFAYSIAQVKTALDVTHELGGENYVFWGGREGYETLLNTDMKKEAEQLAKFFHMLCDYKHKIGFKGPFLIEPKPCEPTKHQYDHDTQSVHAFLVKHGLEKEFKVNIEANHATLSGHSFAHEVVYALANDIFGSIDANQGDPQLGWDTDQFPTNISELGYVIYLILKAGGFKTGGFNFDAKLRRQSIDLEDLFYGHVSGIDALAKGLLIAEKMINQDFLQDFIEERYKSWDSDMGKKILSGEMTVEEVEKFVLEKGVDPKPVSGRQELLESKMNEAVFL